MKGKGDPLQQWQGAFLCEICFSQLYTTFELQGFPHVWVQFPKELYMENKYKNIKIVRQAFSTQEVDQDLQTNDICSLNKTITKINMQQHKTK